MTCCYCHGRSLGSPPEVTKHNHTTWTLSWTPFPIMLIDYTLTCFQYHGHYLSHSDPALWAQYCYIYLQTVLSAFSVASPAVSCSWPLPVVLDFWLLASCPDLLTCYLDFPFVLPIWYCSAGIWPLPVWLLFILKLHLDLNFNVTVMKLIIIACPL